MAENQGAAALASKRTFLLPVDKSQGSVAALDWALANVVKEGDEILLLHVIPFNVGEPIGGIYDADLAAPVFAKPDPKVDEQRIAEAQSFIKELFFPRLEAAKVPYKVEIVHFATDADSIGEVVANRAEHINSPAVVVARHNRGAVSEFFLGSTTKYLTHHCKQPVVVIQG
eukprot:jgi/Botrbrau1/6410/Bobra.49_1s0027.1